MNNYGVDGLGLRKLLILATETTKAWLEKESRATGVKKEFLVEEALLHHLQALHELPADIIVHPRVVVSPEVAEAVLNQLQAAAVGGSGASRLHAAERLRPLLAYLACV